MRMKRGDRSSGEAICIGIDVQVRRPCAIAAIDSECRMRYSGWLETHRNGFVCEALVDQLDRALGCRGAWHFGIDAPRQPLSEARAWFWDRKTERWRARRGGERGWGRHSEVVIRSCGLANPQWTPPEAAAPEWMELGFELFRELERREFSVHEVFPSASYTMLAGETHQPVTLDFSSFASGPKDMLDAVMAAFSVREFLAGRGQEVGSDGLGTIVLPRLLPRNTTPALLAWPKAS